MISRRKACGQACHPSGFGTIFIAHSVDYELSGTAALELLLEGLRCIISVPLAGNLASAS